MHIAILRQRVSGPGGAEATLQHLARGLVASGHRVTVYAVGADAENIRALGASVGYVAVPVWRGKTARLLSYALNTRWLLRQAQPDVVFSLERTLFQQVYRAGDGCHREWLARRSSVLSLPEKLAEGLSPFHRVMLWLEKRLFTAPELKKVIANSRMVNEEIIHHFQVDPAKIKVIYNGLDHQRFRPVSEEERRALRQRLGAPEGAGIILFVGSGFRRKGLAYLLEAFRRLKDERAQLWVVGKGRVGYYQDLARRLEVAQRVKVWGPQADVAPFYQVANVLALPSLYDPLSNVVLEALGCGCPVLTTIANGAGEFISPGENGEIISLDENAVWGEALRYWHTKSQDPAVGRAAREAVAHLTWEATVYQTLEVLKEAAAEHRM